MSGAILIGTDPASGLAPNQCPFPGLASYDLNQRQSFRGREQETLELAQALFGERLTIITAGSGDGKTSLIHAGLAPLLMSEGIEVAIAEPGGTAPVTEIGEHLLGRLVPLATECLPPLYALRARLRRGTLEKARALLLDEQQERETARGGLPDGRGRNEPYWPSQRPVDLLRGGPLRTWLTNADYPAYLLDFAMAAVARQCGGRAKHEWPGTGATLSEAIRFFERIPAQRECARPTATLHPEAQRKLLLKGLTRAFRLHADQPRYEICLFVDQFEELFVQFRGTGRSASGDAAGAPSQHRLATLTLLGEILARSDWPIRMVLSLRREHYAELDATFLHGAQILTYHLMPMQKSQALSSLRQLAPLGRGGRAPTKAAVAQWNRFAQIAIDLLAVGGEQSWVDATQLSSLGELLWGQELPSDVAETVRTALVRQVEEILSLENAEQEDRALPAERRRHSVTGNRLPKVARTIVEQQEAIDILAQLQIPSGAGGGRRLSLPMSALEAPPWRSRTFRRMMIERLRQARLIRQDKRNEQDYFEIVHERMIDVIEELRQRWKNKLYVDLDQILEHLRAVFRLDPFQRIPLNGEQFATLNANRERLDLSDFAASRIVESILATPELWQADQQVSRDAVDFMKWLAARVDGEAGNLLALDHRSPDGAETIRHRAQLAWRSGELASLALTEAARDCDIGLESSERTSWLLLSSLFHGSEGEHRLVELAEELREGGEGGRAAQG